MQTRGLSSFVRAGAVGLVLAALPALAAAQTLVIVREDTGARVAGAEVYQNCEFRGRTSGDGMLILWSAAAGDRLDVRKLVATGGTGRGSHDGWSYHAWRTNIVMTTDGGQWSAVIGDPAGTQEIIIRPQNTQIGWNLVGSLEYNADPANQADIALGMQRASEYLFDVTDGQFFYEQVTLYEDGERFGDADIQFYGTSWPRAHVGGPWALSDPRYHMFMPGPGFDGSRPTPGTWQTPNGFRTFIHENGHLGLGASDEYYRSGGSATCTSDRYAHPETHRGSIMAYQYDATELCSDLNHNPATAHGEATGQSVWGTVSSNWTGPWLLSTPLLTGTVNPGPTSLSCFARMTPRIVSVPRPSCSPLRLRATSGGAPVTRHPVDLQHRGRTIAQGETDDLGELLIHGAEAGDRVTLRPYATGPWDRCFWDASAVVNQSCGPLDLEATWRCEPVIWDRPFPRIIWMHEGDPPLVDLRIAAQQGGLPLQALLAQDGADEQPVALAYDAAVGAYVGSLPFDAKRAAEFALRFVGVDGKGQPVETISRLHGARFHPGGANMQELFASDGDVTLTVDSQGLPHGAGVVWSDTMFPLAPPNGRVVGARSVTVEGEVALAQPLTLSLRFDPSAVKKGSERLYRMEGGSWKEIPAEFHAEIGRVNAIVDAWGTFAVFGERP
jgi:hypothetical protein